MATSPIGSFDFATTTDVQLAVNYGLDNYSISFKAYSQDTMEVVNNMELKREGKDADWYTDNKNPE